MFLVSVSVSFHLFWKVLDFCAKLVHWVRTGSEDSSFTGNMIPLTSELIPVSWFRFLFLFTKLDVSCFCFCFFLKKKESSKPAMTSKSQNHRNRNIAFWLHDRFPPSYRLISAKFWIFPGIFRFCSMCVRTREKIMQRTYYLLWGWLMRCETFK